MWMSLRSFKRALWLKASLPPPITRELIIDPLNLTGLNMCDVVFLQVVWISNVYIFIVFVLNLSVSADVSVGCIKHTDSGLLSKKWWLVVQWSNDVFFVKKKKTVLVHMCNVLCCVSFIYMCFHMFVSVSICVQYIYSVCRCSCTSVLVRTLFWLCYMGTFLKLSTFVWFEIGRWGLTC